MLEFVKKDKLDTVCEKIKSIYIKKTGKALTSGQMPKSKFLDDFVDRYKDNERVYNNSFYKDKPELMYIDAMFFWLSHNNFAGSITSGDDTLEVVDIKEYE